MKIEEEKLVAELRHKLENDLPGLKSQLVAAPPFIFGWFLTAFGVPFKVKDIFQFLSFFVWIWILSLQKTRDQKNKMNSKKKG